MKYCDITIAYNERSGGIRTYIDEKRRYLLENTKHEHLLIVPAPYNHVEHHERSKTVYVNSPLLPKQDSYRFFLRLGKIRNILLKETPDIIELGSYYASPWAAFGYRERMRETGRDCIIGCYFHTDIAEAYVAAPLRALAQEWLGHLSEPLAGMAGELADVAAGGVERYVGAVFEQCDIAFVPSPTQAARLHRYGVRHVHVLPLGVDLRSFHPRHRSDDIRARYGADPDSLVSIYAGRLSTEKRVLTLVKALERVPAQLKPLLWIAGHGPLYEDLREMAARRRSLRLLPYQADRAAFGRLLASADIYVTAGPHETFALSVIEAQACGLPVVGVDAGALRDRVRDGLGFLAPVDDPQAIANNIVRAAAERAAIGARARRHVEQHFTWDRTFRRLLECYETRLGRPTGAAPSQRV